MTIKNDILKFLRRSEVDEVNTKTICINIFEEYNYENFKKTAEVLNELKKEDKITYRDCHPDTRFLQKGSWYYAKAK